MQKITRTKRQQYLWDYDIDEETFLAILHGERTMGRLDADWLDIDRETLLHAALSPEGFLRGRAYEDSFGIEKTRHGFSRSLDTDQPS